MGVHVSLSRTKLGTHSGDPIQDLDKESEALLIGYRTPLIHFVSYKASCLY